MFNLKNNDNGSTVQNSNETLLYQVLFLKLTQKIEIFSCDLKNIVSIFKDYLSNDIIQLF